MTILFRALLTATMFVSFTAEAEPTYILFDVHGAISTSPVGIAADGSIAGNYLTESEGFGFLRAPDGSITTLNVPNVTSMHVTGMSANGMITGLATDQDTGTDVGFIRDAKGNFTKFSAGAGLATLPRAINDKGTTAGLTSDSSGNIRGFIREKSGTVTLFDIAGSDTVWPNAINANREMVGQADSDLGPVAFVRSKKGTISNIALPGGLAYDATGVNSFGTIVGVAHDRITAFIVSTDGSATIFEVSKGNGETQADGINDKGTVFGLYRDKTTPLNGFIRAADGTVAKFDLPKKVEYVSPIAINNSDAVTGTYTTPKAPNIAHGFLRLP